MSDAFAVVDRVVQIVDDGNMSSTYKLAVLLGLLDLCVESTDALGWPPTVVTTRQLAEKVVALYWPQVRDFGADHRPGPLQQNRGQRGVILRAVAVLRAAADGVLPVGAGLGRARVALPDAYQACIDTVEWKLVEMPLPKLQRVGGEDTGWLYRIRWDDGPNRPARGQVLAASQGRRSSFDNTIRLLPDVATAFARLHAILRPYIEQRWTGLVAKMNALEEARLHRFLFGADRTALRAVAGALTAAQADRCFYCADRVRSVEVDHFLPWARVPDDGLANLVAACRPCNNAKRDHLASADHLRRWRWRDAEQLAAIAADTGWEVGRARTLGVARGLYLHLPAGSRLWRSRSSGLQQASEADLRAVLTASGDPRGRPDDALG